MGLRRLAKGGLLAARLLIALVRSLVTAIRTRGRRRRVVTVPITRSVPTTPRPVTAIWPPPDVWVDGTKIELPTPSVWPAVVALGVALLLFGIIISLVFSAVGFLVLVLGLGGWIGELRHDG